MRILSSDARRSLASKVIEYHEQIAGPATSYLETRGVGTDAISLFQLGYSGQTGDYRAGRLTIPYLSPAGPWLIKYRCIQHTDCKAVGCSKYVYDEGGETETHLFNAGVLKTAELVVVTEGEIDAISGQMTGVPHVGYPGAQTWRKKKFWTYAFDSVDEIVVVGDGDMPEEGQKYGVGERAAREVTDMLRKAHVDAVVRMAVMPVGYDANKVIREKGPMAYLELIGVI